ncbi:hypothetical protein BGZ52_000995 [Haplosporangium bisporale]|nr:hypothetical protein BGZ52_000995 [Haplosporangium bisporale]
MFLQQDALALLYTLTRISVSWLLSLLLCLVVCGRMSQDVIYLSQQSVPNLIINCRSWFARNTGGARSLLILFMLLSIPVTLLPSILTRFHGVQLEPGLDPGAHRLQDYTANNLTFDSTSSTLSINPQIGSNKITANVLWEPVELDSIITFPGRPWSLVYNSGNNFFSALQFNQTFVNRTGMLLVNGSYAPATDNLNLQSFQFVKDLVATYFTPDVSYHNTTAYNTNIDFIPHTPTGLTTPSSLTTWAALMDQNGTAILETGIVGFRSMRSGLIGFNCSVAQDMFVEGDPSLCFDNWVEGNPSVNGGGMYMNRTGSVQTSGAILTEIIYGMWHQMSVKTVKSTVLLGKSIVSDSSATAIYGSGQEARPPLDFQLGSTPVAVDDDVLAHLLFLVGSGDVVQVGSYGIGRTFSAATLVIWGLMIIALPIAIYIVVVLFFKELAIAMNHCWDAVMSSATFGRNFQGGPLKVSLHPTPDGRAGVLINHSALRAVDEGDGLEDLAHLNSPQYR